MSAAETVTDTLDRDFPRNWRWDADGLRAAGTYVRMDEGPTEYGRQAILVLEIDGEERSIWVTQEALKGRLRDELERRGESDFAPGERIVIERAAEKRESESGRSYWPFTTRFPDAPKRSAADLLGAASPDAKPDDDIPY